MRSRSPKRKSKSQFSNTSLKTWPRNLAKSDRKSQEASIPKNAAVHFGSFYGLQEDAKKVDGKKGEWLMGREANNLKSRPRMEFTRQMVRNLERAAGTDEYARQVSALLDETVEPANFKLSSPPAENSVPYGIENPSGYPLWYKEPYKMPMINKEARKAIEEKYSEDIFDSRKFKDVFGDESLEGNFSESLVDESEESNFDDSDS